MAGLAALTAVPSEPEILFADVIQTPDLRYMVDIYLDGKEVKRCITANVIDGWCDVFETDGEGRFVLNSDRTAISTKRLYGTVRIERKQCQ